MASNKIDDIRLLNPNKLNKTEIPDQATVQGNSAAPNSGFNNAVQNGNGWNVEASNKSSFRDNTRVNYISDCPEAMPNDSIGMIFNNLIQKLGYAPKQELQPQQPIPVKPVEPSEKDIKNHAVDYLNTDISKAQRLFWDKNQNQGAISDAYSWSKDLFDTEFSKTRVGRILATEQLAANLITKANELDLTKKEYYETKLDFAMRMLPKDKYSQMQIDYLKKALGDLKPEELDGFITAVATCNDSDYVEKVPKVTDQLINGAMQKDVQPLDSPRYFKIADPNSVQSIINNKNNSQILMPFEETFALERGTSYDANAIKDYTTKEAQMNLIVAMRNKNAEIKELLHNATVTVDGNNKYGAEFSGAIEPCRKNLERTLAIAYERLYGENVPQIDRTDSYSLVQMSKELQAKLDENYNKVLNGKSFEEYQTEYSQAYKTAYGNKNGTALAESFIESQVKGVQYIKTGVQGVGMLALIAGQCIPVGGQAATALVFGGLTTATAGGSAIQLTEDLTKQGGITDDDKRAIAQELATSVALMASGMGIGKVSTMAYSELVMANCPRLLALSGKIGVDATMSMLATQAITGQVDLTSEGISQLIPIIAGVLKARGNFRSYLDAEVQPRDLTKKFDNDNTTHPLTDRIREINARPNYDPKKLVWIQDWKLDKTDYSNMSKLANLHNGKYIEMWKSTATDGVDNVQKLAVLEKVMRRNNGMDAMLKLDEKDWDVVVRSVCSAKSSEELVAILSYRVSSKEINTALSNKTGTIDPITKDNIDALTKHLDNSIIQNEIKVHRGEDYKGILNFVESKNGQSIANAMEELIARNASKPEILDFIDRELMDVQVVQERFISTSLDKDFAQDWAHRGALTRENNPNGGIRWDITVPKGSKGAFIEDFNVMRVENQCEVLIQRNSILDIKNVEFDEITKTWIIEAKLVQN